MAGRPGLFGGPRHGDASEGDALSGHAQDPLTSGSPVLRFGANSGGPDEGAFGAASGFDPVWGTLGPPTSPTGDPWLSGPQDPDEGGPTLDVDIFGDGFEIAGQIDAGQFPRLSDWLNMQQGFIRVRNASIVRLGLGNLLDPDHRAGTLWLRLDQIVLVAERVGVQTARPGAPMVQKQRRRVTMVTPGYSLRGSLHVHAFGSMKQFLESPDPHFLPVTELAVRRLSEGTLVIRFQFALINRDQLISVLDDDSTPAVESADPGQGETRRNDEAEMPLHKRSGAA